MFKKISFLLITIQLFGFFFVSIANAQLQSANINLNINPQYPMANTEVKAILSTNATNLNLAKITWVVDGNLILEGVGKKNLTFTVGDNGTTTILEITIESSEGYIITKKLNITPGDVDLLWEAYDTYAPPFYKGKTLAPKEGMIKMVAIPSISNKNGYNYQWTQDDTKKPGSSGYNKNYYLYKNSYLEKTNTVSITVQDLSGKIIGAQKIELIPKTPKIIFYENDPILGTKYEKALNYNFSIDQNGSTIVAEPYFFSPKNLNSNSIDFKWTLGGEEVSTPTTKNMLSIKPQEEQSGTSTIGLTISNINTLFLTLKKSLDVTF